LGELNWSSQHLEAGGCDGQSKTAFRHDLGGRHCCHQVDARGRRNERRRFWAAIAAAWQVRTLRLRPVCRRLSEQDGSGRQAACHQRCLDDRRSRSPGDICRLRNGRSLRSYVCRARECGRSPGRWGGQRRRSRGSCDAMPRRAAGPGLSGNHSAVACGPGRSAPKPAKLAINAALRAYVQDRLAGVVVTPRGAAVPGPAGVLERSPTRTSAGSAVGLGVEPGADCPSLTARLPAR